MRSITIAHRAPHSIPGTIQNSMKHLDYPHMQCPHPLPAADQFMYLVQIKPPLISTCSCCSPISLIFFDARSALIVFSSVQYLALRFFIIINPRCRLYSNVIFDDEISNRTESSSRCLLIWEATRTIALPLYLRYREVSNHLSMDYFVHLGTATSLAPTHCRPFSFGAQHQASSPSSPPPGAVNAGC